MKHILYFIAISTWLCISATSCSNNEEKIDKSIEPGVYYVGMDINAMHNVTTRGYSSAVNNFTETYDYDNIYLINGNTGESISIPIVDNCPDGESTCTGIRYQIEVNENGSATITALNAEGNPTGTSLEVGKEDDCYFSSYDKTTWELEDTQKGTNSLGSQKFTFYTKNENTNVEIYRSGTLENSNLIRKNYSIEDLTTNGDLDLIRECAGFRVVGFFYDEENGSMGANTSLGGYEDWYIKIYLGGTAFPESYSFLDQTCTGNGGYYSSGPVTSETPYTTKFSQLRDLVFSIGGDSSLEGYGYLSYVENHLYTPLKKDGELHVYILVKRWTNNEKGPDEEWLSSDIGAIQTEAKATISDVGNNNYYTLGLTLPASHLVEAWEKAYPSTETSNNSTITRSPLGAEVRSFTVPENAIVCEIN